MVTRVGRAHRVILVTLVFRVGLVLVHQVIQVGRESQVTLDGVVGRESLDTLELLVTQDGQEFLGTAALVVILDTLVHLGILDGVVICLME